LITNVGGGPFTFLGQRTRKKEAVDGEERVKRGLDFKMEEAIDGHMWQV